MPSADNELYISRRGFLVQLPLGVFGLILSGCTDQTIQLNVDQAAILERRGFSTPRPLVDLRSIPGFSFRGNVAGGFLSISGAAEGETQSVVQFAWQTAEERPRIILSELPFTKAVFEVVEEDSVKPVVLLHFNQLYNLHQWVPQDQGGPRYTAFDSENPNDFLITKGSRGQDRLLYATFTLSRRDFGDFRTPR